MASFNQVSESVRASNVFIELAGVRRSLASLFIPPHLGLIGQYDVGKTGIADYDPQTVIDSNDVGNRYGFGSHIHRQALKIPASVYTSGGGVTAFPVPEAAGTAATTDLTFTGTAATSSGTYYFNVGDVLVQVGVLKDATPTDVAASLDAAITAIRDITVGSSPALGVTTITAKGKGTYGNQIFIKQNPGGKVQEDAAPAGLTVSGVDVFLTSGATDPSVHDVFLETDESDKLGGTWYTVFTAPYADATNLSYHIASGELRFDPAVRRFHGSYPFYVDKNRTEALAIPATLNSRWIGGAWDTRPHAPAFEISAEIAGLIAEEQNQNPARPYKTLPLSGGGNSDSPNSTYAQEDALFNTGMGFCVFDLSGILRLGDLPLTYRTDVNDGVTEEWFDAVSLHARQAKVYSIELLFSSEPYTRGVVVDNNAITQIDFAIAPKDVISDLTKLVNQLWVPQGWTKNGNEVIAGITAEINAGNNSRIDASITDDEAKALRIIAIKYSFLF